MKINREFFYFSLPIEQIGKIFAVIYIVLGFIATILSGLFSILVTLPLLIYQETSGVSFAFYTYFIFAILTVCAGFVYWEGISQKKLNKIKMMLITQLIGLFLSIITFILLMRSNLVKILTIIMAVFMFISIFYTHCLFVNFQKIIELNKKDQESRRKQSEIVPVHRRRRTLESKKFNESQMI